MFEPQPNAIVANRYRLLREIGRGGMGSVWEAVDTELDAPCALKFILNQSTKPPEVRARFMREARAVARLQSPHVVSIRGVGEWQEALYIAMELLVGETLFGRLARTGTLSPRETTRVIDQIASVLAIAHRDGIVHRDLKPDNIWLWSQGELLVKLLDFGVAKHALDDGSLLKTATGTLVGTPYYMSPEQAAGDRRVDHRSDLWSLAIIAVQCLSGRLPFESTGLGQLLASIITGETPPVSNLYSAATPSLQQWWLRATAKDPAERYQSAQTLAHEFAVAMSLRSSDAPLDGSGISFTPAKASPREPLVATSSLSPVTARPVPTQMIDGSPVFWVKPDASGTPPTDEPTEAAGFGPRPDTSAAGASIQTSSHESQTKTKPLFLVAAVVATLGGGLWLWGKSDAPSPTSPEVPLAHDAPELGRTTPASPSNASVSHEALPAGPETSSVASPSATTRATSLPTATGRSNAARAAALRPNLRPAPVPAATRPPAVSPNPRAQHHPGPHSQPESSVDDRVGF